MITDLERYKEKNKKLREEIKDLKESLSYMQARNFQYWLAISEKDEKIKKFEFTVGYLNHEINRYKQYLEKGDL